MDAYRIKILQPLDQALVEARRIDGENQVRRLRSSEGLCLIQPTKNRAQTGRDLEQTHHRQDRHGKQALQPLGTPAVVQQPMRRHVGMPGALLHAKKRAAAGSTGTTGGHASDRPNERHVRAARREQREDGEER